MTIKRPLLLISLFVILLASDASRVFSYSGADAPSWASDAVDQACQRMLIDCSLQNHQFSSQLNRAVGYQMLTKGFNIWTAAARSPFRDVIGQWYETAANTSYTLGWTVGRNGLFLGNDNFTRAQMAVSVSAILGLSPGTSTVLSSYSDSSQIPTWAVGQMAAMVNAGLIGQGGINRLNPNSPASKLEAIIVLNSAVSYAASHNIDVIEVAARRAGVPIALMRQALNEGRNIANGALIEPIISRNLILGTFIPRVELNEGQFGELNINMMERLVNLGINYFESQIEFITKDVNQRQQMRQAFVSAAKSLGVTYAHSLPLVGERIEDDNFLGGIGWLDEPFSLGHFPDTAIIPASAINSIAASQDVAQAATLYQNYIRSLIDVERNKERTGEKLPGVYNPFEVAWYDYKAGSSGFLYELPGYLYLQEIHFFNAQFNLGIPETTENFIRLSAAMNRGASRNFGNKPWGLGINKLLPSSLWWPLLQGLYDRGANYFFFWSYHLEDNISQDELMDLTARLKSYSDTHPPTKATANTAILIPANYHIPTGGYASSEYCNYCANNNVCGSAGSGCVSPGSYNSSGLWNMIQIGKNDTADPNTRILRAFGQAVKDALNSPDEFDVLINDEALSPGLLNQYQRVVRIE